MRFEQKEYVAAVGELKAISDLQLKRLKVGCVAGFLAGVSSVYLATLLAGVAGVNYVYLCLSCATISLTCKLFWQWFQYGKDIAVIVAAIRKREIRVIYEY